MTAIEEGLDCVEIRSEESKAEERKEAMRVKTKFPADWLEANRAFAQMSYVHACDTSRFFVVSFRQLQGNRIEVKIEKVKKVPSLTESTPPTVLKFIPMGAEDLGPEIFSRFDAAPWQPEAEQLKTFREFIKKEITTSAQPQGLF